jgi:hypothetical protein
MSMTNCTFRCDYDEKNRFMVEADRLGLDSAFLLRRFIHLFLTDKEIRRILLTLENPEKEAQQS